MIRLPSLAPNLVRQKLLCRSLESLHHETGATVGLPVLIKASIRVVQGGTVLAACSSDHGDTQRHIVTLDGGVGSSALATGAGSRYPVAGSCAGACAEGAVAGHTLVVGPAKTSLGAVEARGDADTGETALRAVPAGGWAFEGLHGHCRIVWVKVGGMCTRETGDESQ